MCKASSFVEVALLMETDCSSDDFETSETEARAEESVLVILATECPEGQHTSVIDLGR